MSVPIASNFYFNCTGRKFSSVCVDSKLCRPKWRAGDEESIARQAGSGELHVSAAHTQDALPIWINVIPPTLHSLLSFNETNETIKPEVGT